VKLKGELGVGWRLKWKRWKRIESRIAENFDERLRINKLSKL
jgi:hypothetical protein